MSFFLCWYDYRCTIQNEEYGKGPGEVIRPLLVQWFTDAVPPNRSVWGCQGVCCKGAAQLLGVQEEICLRSKREPRTKFRSRFFTTLADNLPFTACSTEENFHGASSLIG